MDGIQFIGKTDVGRKRTGNEDRFYVDRCWDDAHVLALCIDGCGGYDGGEVAAQMVLDEVCAYLDKHREGNRLDLLKEAVVYANNRVHEARKADEMLSRMCCVMTAALIELQEQRINMVHVGDTRLYAVSDGRIIKLSHDHSPVGRDEEAGVLTETEAMQSPSRNIIERAMGEKFLQPDTDYLETAVLPMTKGIKWLFCSDGLCDMVTSAEMTDILGQQIPLEEQADKLIAAANEAGGKDNITVILVHAAGEPDNDTQAVMDEYAERLNPVQDSGYSELMKRMFRSTEDQASADQPSLEESLFIEMPQEADPATAEDEDDPSFPASQEPQPEPVSDSNERGEGGVSEEVPTQANTSDTPEPAQTEKADIPAKEVSHKPKPKRSVRIADIITLVLAIINLLALITFLYLQSARG